MSSQQALSNVFTAIHKVAVPYAGGIDVQLHCFAVIIVAVSHSH